MEHRPYLKDILDKADQLLDSAGQQLLLAQDGNLGSHDAAQAASIAAAEIVALAFEMFERAEEAQNAPHQPVPAEDLINPIIVALLSVKEQVEILAQQAASDAHSPVAEPEPQPENAQTEAQHIDPSEIETLPIAQDLHDLTPDPEPELGIESEPELEGERPAEPALETEPEAEAEPVAEALAIVEPADPIAETDQSETELLSTDDLVADDGPPTEPITSPPEASPSSADDAGLDAELGTLCQTMHELTAELRQLNPEPIEPANDLEIDMSPSPEGAAEEAPEEHSAPHASADHEAEQVAEQASELLASSQQVEFEPDRFEAVAPIDSTTAAPQEPQPEQRDPALQLEPVDTQSSPPREDDAAEAATHEPDPAQPADASFADAPATLSPEEMAALMAEGTEQWGSRPLNLTPEKTELVQFMVLDLRQSVEQVGPLLNELRDPSSRAEVCQTLAETAASMLKAAEFFEFVSLNELLRIFSRIAQRLPDLSEQLLPELFIRAQATLGLLEQHAGALEVAMEMVWPLETFSQRIDTLLSGRQLSPVIVGWHQNNVDRLLELDKVVESFEPIPDPDDPNAVAYVPPPTDPASPAAQGPTSATPAAEDKAAAAPTIRVPEPLIERMLDAARQLVLNKNRISALSTRARADRSDNAAMDELAACVEELGRLTTEVQTAVMSTRTLPLERIFERYKRVIRDVANLNDKQIDLKTRGEHTTADRAMIEALTEPLGQLLRFCAARSIEKPDERTAANKPPTGSILISAESQGTHLLIRVTDDGRGLDRNEVIKGAADLGIDTPQELEPLTDDQLFERMLREGFEGSGLEGVHTALARLGARTTMQSLPAQGLSFQIVLPLQLAVVASMMIDVAGEVYAVPMQSVLEIVRVEQVSLHSITGKPVVRIRDKVLPVTDLRRLFGAEPADPAKAFALVVHAGGKSSALLADAILGRREIVTERLRDHLVDAGPFSGATIGDSGDVALILDLMEVLSAAEAA